MTVSESLAWAFAGCATITFVATCIASQRRTKALRDELRNLEKSMVGRNDVLIKVLDLLEKVLKQP